VTGRHKNLFNSVWLIYGVDFLTDRCLVSVAV
jgi:hypothetical protein